MYGKILPCILLPLCISGPLHADYEADFNTRAELLVDWVANVYKLPGSNPYTNGPSDEEKYTGPKMVARMAMYGADDPDGLMLPTGDSHLVNANEWIRQGAGGAHFHFTFVGPAIVFTKFADAPALSEAYGSRVVDGTTYTETVLDSYILEVMSRADNYSAFTGEGTENHINMNRTSAWIYTKLAQQSPLYAALSADSPATYPDAEAKEAEMRNYLLEWARQLYAVGCAEYDSSVYFVYNAAPWINLFEATKPEYFDDPELHAAARAVLDWFAAAAALKYRYGIFNGASVRGEAKVDRYNRGADGDFLLWLWYGSLDDIPNELTSRNPRVENQPNWTTFAATSSYRPPAAAVALARKENMIDTVTRHGRPNYLMSRASESLEQYYIGPSYTLGAAQFPYGGWVSAVYRVNMWKLAAESDGYLPWIIQGNNGMRALEYNFRNPWVQVVQDRNVVIQMNRVPVDAQAQHDAAMSLIRDTWVEDWHDDVIQRYDVVDYNGYSGDSTDSGRKTPVKAETGNPANARDSYIFFDPALSETAAEENVRFGRAGETYFAIRAVDGDTPAYNSSGHFSDFSDYGTLGGLVIEVGSSADADYNTFAGFQTHYMATTSLARTGDEVTYTAMDGREIVATYHPDGGYTEPEYDWVYGVTEPVAKMFLSEYATGENPPESWTLPEFPAGDGSGRVASWSVDPDGDGPAAAQAYGPDSVWPVFDGPNIRLSGGVLILSGGSSVYSVDYSGEQPVVMDGSLPVPDSAIHIDAGNAVIEVPTLNGLQYQLYRSDDLGDPWTAVGEPVTGDGSVAAFDGGPADAITAAFWRISVAM